jgi:dihydroorotate dehydrogenase (NAD+) catalytic subunit
MIKEPFYDPQKSYYENYDEGPFGDFADAKKIKRNNETPNQSFLGFPTYTKFGIPAGPLLNSKYVISALDKGFDLPIYKTVRSHKHGCHEYPNVLPIDFVGDLTFKKAEEGLTVKEKYDSPLSITNSFGVPSFDPNVWQPDVEKAVKHAKGGQIVGLSFQGTRLEGASVADYFEDWVSTAKLAKETGAPYLEANLSCPNEGTTALLCFDIERVGKISRMIKEAIGDTPLLLKISYFTDQSLLEKLVKEVGEVVEGFSTINTISAEVRDKNGGQALPGKDRLRSGVCGESIKWAGLEMVERFVGLRTKHNLDFSVVGVGGVMNVDDYKDYLEAGADAIMSATGAMWNPTLGSEVYEDANLTRRFGSVG